MASYSQRVPNLILCPPPRPAHLNVESFWPVKLKVLYFPQTRAKSAGRTVAKTGGQGRILELI